MSTVAIILAADPSPGFPRSRYLETIGDRPLLQHVVDDASKWPVDDVIIAIGPDAEEVVDVIDFGDCTVVIDPEWECGTSSPLGAALDLISRDRNVERCVIARGDQPGISSTVVGELLAVAVETSVDAVLPKYRYALGWPVVLDYSTWGFFLGAEGAVDLHDVVASHIRDTEEIWYDHLLLKVYVEPRDFTDLTRGSKNR